MPEIKNPSDSTKEAILPRKKDTKEPVKKVTPEHGGPKGPEPTRYGDWEKNGRCIDF